MLRDICLRQTGDRYRNHFEMANNVNKVSAVLIMQCSPVFIGSLKCSVVLGVSASCASGLEIDPRTRHIFCCIFPLSLIHEEQVVKWVLNAAG